MNGIKYNRLGNKKKVTKLINKGIFDDHIEEISKALYTKRLFTKDIKCFFNNINKKSNIFLTPKNNKKIFGINNSSKKILNKTNMTPSHKKASNEVNSYDLIKYKEDEINKEMQNLLKMLNNSQDETNNKFQELKKENEFFNTLYKIYKRLLDSQNKENPNINDNNIFIFLYDLLIKYKSKKNLTFDINSLFSDVLKESPLSTNDSEKLKFYYIINSERFDNLNDNNNNKSMNEKKENKMNPLLAMYNHDNNIDNNPKKIELPKEPKIIDMTKIKNLKEMKYLNKINRRTKYKIITGGKIIGVGGIKSLPPKLDNINLNFEKNKENNEEEFEENEDEEDKINFQSYEDKINEKMENKLNKENKMKLKLDIIKDIEDINILKKTLKDSFQNERKRTIRLKKTNSNFEKLILKDRFKDNLYLSLYNNNDKKRNSIGTSFDNDNENDSRITYKKKINFSKITNKNKLQKINIKEKNNLIINKEKKGLFHSNKNNNFYNKSSLSSKNIFQGSTYYSNQSNINNNNNSIISKFSPNSSLNISNQFNNSPKKKVQIFDDNLMSTSQIKKNIMFNTNFEKPPKLKTFKKYKTLFQGNESELFNNMLNYRADDIYYISKNINGKNSLTSINKINEYLKYTNSKLPLLYKGNKLKDTYSFFRRIKKEIENNEIKNKFQDIKKLLNDNERKKLNDIGLLESNLLNKEKELLIKILRNKY